MRPAPGRVSEIWHLPDLLTKVGRSGIGPWRPQRELVVERGQWSEVGGQINPRHFCLGPLTPEPRPLTSPMMTDPIADMLTCIRNAVRIERPRVEMPLSKVKCGLAEVLKREGYIWDWREEHEDGAPSKQLSIELKYGPNGERVIRHIRRVSKPGRRVYSPATALRPVLIGLGISIISTSRGVISDREARQRNLGGEVLCEVW